jgi:hypothetical protein
MSRPCRIRVLVLWAAFGCAAALVTAPTASADPVRPSEDRVSNSGRISGATPTVAPAGVRSIRSRALRSAAPAIIACEPITSAVTTPAHARSSRAAPGCSAATRQGSRTTALMTRIAVIVSTQSRPRCQRRSMTATSAPRLKVTSAASGPTIGRSAPPSAMPRIHFRNEFDDCQPRTVRSGFAAAGDRATSARAAGRRDP